MFVGKYMLEIAYVYAIGWQLKCPFLPRKVENVIKEYVKNDNVHFTFNWQIF